MANVRPDDIVRAHNSGDVALTVKWNSRKYVLSPGKDVFIPGACAFLWFGDPRAGAKFQSLLDEEGNRSFVVDRATEVRRLRIKYGAGIAGDEASFDGIAAVPNVQVYTAEGEQIVTVLDDPEGKSVMPASLTAQDDASLRELVASQQRQIELMKEHLGLNDGEAQAAADESELPVDGDAISLPAN
jgi:hypothetical protein